jgi:hypothetical protein
MFDLINLKEDMEMSLMHVLMDQLLYKMVHVSTQLHLHMLLS